MIRTKRFRFHQKNFDPGKVLENYGNWESWPHMHTHCAQVELVARQPMGNVRARILCKLRSSPRSPLIVAARVKVEESRGYFR